MHESEGGGKGDRGADGGERRERRKSRIHSPQPAPSPLCASLPAPPPAPPRSRHTTPPPPSPSLTHQTHAKLATQWAALAAAPEKSIKGRVHRAAQAILSREHPVASFCRSLPPWAPACRTVGGGAGGGGPPALIFAHPPCLPTRLVRRRTRALVAAARPTLARRAAGWSLAVLPLIPTLLTPVRRGRVREEVERAGAGTGTERRERGERRKTKRRSNHPRFLFFQTKTKIKRRTTKLPAFPLYYTLWKAYSAVGALRGATTLARALAASDAAQLAGVREAIAVAAAGGHLPPPGSWAAALARADPSAPSPSSTSPASPYLDLLDTADARIAAHYHGHEAAAALAPTFVADAALAGVDGRAVRAGGALPDALAAGLEASLPAPGLLAAVARVRKAAAGAAFPAAGPAVVGAGGGPAGPPAAPKPGLAAVLGVVSVGGAVVTRGGAAAGQCPSPPAAGAP